MTNRGLDPKFFSQKQRCFDSEKVMTINDLRNDDQIRYLLKKELKKLGLCEFLDGDDSSSESENESSVSNQSNSSESDVKKEHKHRVKKSRKKVSGINAKASDRVKYPQRWPQSHLQFEYVNKQMKFEDLDFKLFVAGELEIIACVDVYAVEKAGRLELLRKIAYYYGTYEFAGLKSFYAAWLREIELGKKKWSDDSQQIETAILSKYVLKNKAASNFKKDTSSNFNNSMEERVWFCSEFQRNKCLHKNNHLCVIKGKQRMATHICASCWLKDRKKMEHPESSSCCPHLPK